jgi:hypothetical protein
LSVVPKFVVCFVIGSSIKYQSLPISSSEYSFNLLIYFLHACDLFVTSKRRY